MKNIALFLLFSLVLTACMPKITKEEFPKIQTIGIDNQFPEYPYFTKVGTTMFQNNYGSIEDGQFLRMMNDELIKQLSDKGYKVVLLDADKSRADVDLVLEIKPEKARQMVDAHGYGVYERSVFGSTSVVVYTSFYITPYVNGEEKSCWGSCYADVVMGVSNQALPETWDDVAEEKKAYITMRMKSAFKQSFEQSLQSTGLFGIPEQEGPGSTSFN